MPESVTFIDLQSMVGVMFGLLAAVAVAWGGVKAIKEAISPLTKLIKDANHRQEQVDGLEKGMEHVRKRFAEYDEYFENDKRALKKDREELEDLKKANTLVLRGMNQLIEHELTGNQTEELRQTQKDITEYLLNR